MMKRLLASLILVTFIAAPSYAQDVAPRPSTLTVTGEGTAAAVPDVLVINVGVSTRGETPAEALASNSTQMQSVIDAVLGAGIAETDVSTSGFYISPIYDDQRYAEGNQTPRILGYEVGNQVTIRVRDVATSSDILDGVVAAGANQINGISFEIADPQPLQDAAMRDAIADARRQAELMADAAGMRIVGILSINSSNGAPQPMYDAVQFARSATPIMTGQQSISASATLTFEIVPAQ